MMKNAIDVELLLERILLVAEHLSVSYTRKGDTEQSMRHAGLAAAAAALLAAERS